MTVTKASNAGRPPETVSQKGAEKVDWSKTYHVDSAEGFISGLFGLHSGLFDDFLADAGNAAGVGDTILYQVARQLSVRFEIKKIGPHEFEIRGAHFAGPNGVNICVGFNPLEESSKVTVAQSVAQPQSYVHHLMVYPHYYYGVASY